jgi:predicted CoA-binding protein
MNSSKAVDAFLAQPVIAVVGVSRSGRKFGNAAFRTLRDKGYRVYAIHPHAKAIEGEQCYPSLTATPERVNAVLIVVPPVEALAVLRESAAAGIHHVWLQQGAESTEAVSLCAELGIQAVSGECILMFARPTGIHRAHRFVRRVFDRLPA